MYSRTKVDMTRPLDSVVVAVGNSVPEILKHSCHQVGFMRLRRRVVALTWVGRCRRVRATDGRRTKTSEAMRLVSVIHVMLPRQAQCLKQLNSDIPLAF